MLPLQNIFNVQIDRTTTGIDQVGFGTVLILGTNATHSDRVRPYSNLDEVAEDFLTSDEEYLAAAAIFSQNPKVTQIKIGKEAAKVAQVLTLTFSADLITGNTVNLKINGVSIAAVPFNTSHNQTMTDLATAIQASSLIATASVSASRVITITAQNAGQPITISNVAVTGGASQATGTVATTTASHGVQDDLAEITDIDPDWYGLILVDRTQLHVELAAQYIEAQEKIFFTASDDANILVSTNTTNLAYVLNAAGYNRTAVWYTTNPNDFIDAAAFGEAFPFNPGTRTYKFKTLDTISAEDITTSQRNALKGFKANVYEESGGRNITAEGTMASGEFIDVIIGIDWTTARIRENLALLFFTAGKVPFTDEGISLVYNQIQEILEQAERLKIIANDPKYTIVVPKASEVSSQDRAARTLTGVKFKARLAGAIHFVDVLGEVTV